MNFFLVSGKHSRIFYAHIITENGHEIRYRQYFVQVSIYWEFIRIRLLFTFEYKITFYATNYVYVLYIFALDIFNISSAVGPSKYKYASRVFCVCMRLHLCHKPENFTQTTTLGSAEAHNTYIRVLVWVVSFDCRPFARD